MKHTLTFFVTLSAAFLLAGCCAAKPCCTPNAVPECSAQKQNAEKKIRTGLYVDFGSRGAGLIRWALLLKHSPQIELRLLDGQDLVQGDLSDLDLIVMPGGSSRRQYSSMQQDKGGDNLRKFVENGGKYFGTCAGMSIILHEKGRVPMLPYIRSSGHTGGVTASIKLNEEGQKLLGLPAEFVMRYHNGPIVHPSKKPLDKISVKELGSFNCDLCQKGKIVRSMYGTPALFLVTFDKGKLFVTNCHPEIYTVSHPVIPAGIKLLTGREIELVYPVKKSPRLRVAYLCPGMGGKKPIENLFALDARQDVDVFAATNEDIQQGLLEHADLLFVAPAYPNDAKLFAAQGYGHLIRDFVDRGGRIVRSLDEVK